MSIIVTFHFNLEPRCWTSRFPETGNQGKPLAGETRNIRWTFALYPFPGHARTLHPEQVTPTTLLPDRTSPFVVYLTPTASDSNFLANHDLGSARDLQIKGRPASVQPLISINALCSNLEPVFTPPALRKSSVCRHVTPHGGHCNRVFTPCLLYPHTLRGGMWSLYHSIYRCNGRESHPHSVPAPCGRICYPSFASGACVLWNALHTRKTHLASRSA